jgi:broad specificity phosphatase PhoE
MPLKLVLIRHAETLWNRERRYLGRQDPPLSETGRAQADAVGQLLAKEQIEAVWSSPLRRARETAEAIATLRGLTVRVDDQFGEMHFGQWEGLTSEEVSAKFPEMYRTWLDTPHLATVPNGETLSDVRGRALQGLSALRQAHDGGTVALVTHGVTGRILILEALGLGLDRIWSLQVSFTGISELEFRDDWAVVHRMNSLVHLERRA